MAQRSKTTNRPANIAASKRGREWLWGLLLMLAVFAVYQPAWYAGYVWDDDSVLTSNPAIVGPGNLKDIWTTSSADISPLTLSTFWLENQIWGVTPLPYHLVNVLLQAICAVLLWRVLLVLRIPGAWLGAALWALHPVQVESVAWISEMKNTESGIFYLLAILCFVKSLPSGGKSRRFYFASLVFSALAMASKSSTVILPVVLCLVAWWTEGRLQWRRVFRTAPMFGMALIAGLVTMWTQQVGGANDPQWTRSWPERLADAGDAVWFYLGKLAWPHPLIAIYPRWHIDTGDWLSYAPLLLVIVLFAALWALRRTWARPCFFAFAYFLIALLPALGLLSNYIFRYGVVFDHFQYLASMGPLALAGAGFFWLGRVLNLSETWRSVAAGSVLLVLAIMSWGQTWAYQSQMTLWLHTLDYNPTCPQAFNNLGIVMDSLRRDEDAAACFAKAIANDPKDAEAHYNLAILLNQHGQVDAAIEHLKEAVAINPNYAGAQNNLGVVLAQKGEGDEAIPHYLKALEINPNWADVHSNLGALYAQKGEFDKAIPEFQKALKSDPHSVKAHTNLGNALLHENLVDEAITEFQTALLYDATLPQIHFDYGNALEQKGHLDEAAAQYQEALRLNPGYQKARENLERLRYSMQSPPTAK
jgi:tetratricopeptide (TPR) repeat protein